MDKTAAGPRDVTANLSRTAAQDDEVDLFQLLELIWKRKATLVLFIAVTTLAALAYAFLAPEKWEATAQITKPRIAHTLEYVNQRRAIARATGGSIDAGALNDSLFNAFIYLASSQDYRMRFLEATDYYRRLQADAPDTDKDRLRSLATRSLTIRAPDNKQITPHYSVSFLADNAKDAQSILDQFFGTVDADALALVDSEFRHELRASILARQAAIDDMDFHLRSERDIHIATLESALSTAKNAGIKDYGSGRHAEGNTLIELNNTNRLFMLGEKYLSAELETGNATPIIYPVEYFKLKREVELLTPALNYIPAARTYDYQLTPDLSVTKKGPKRALILALGLILGGMLGCVWILASAVIRDRRT